VWLRAWLTWTDRAAGDERRPAAGRNRGLGLWQAIQNRDVTPAAWLARAWLTRTDGRAGGYKQSRRRAAWRLVLLICWYRAPYCSKLVIDCWAEEWVRTRMPSVLETNRCCEIFCLKLHSESELSTTRSCRYSGPLHSILWVHYAGRVHSRKRNVTVWRPSIRLSVCPLGILTVTHQSQHTTRPSYISARR